MPHAQVHENGAWIDVAGTEHSTRRQSDPGFEATTVQLNTCWAGVAVREVGDQFGLECDHDLFEYMDHGSYHPARPPGHGKFVARTIDVELPNPPSSVPLLPGE